MSRKTAHPEVLFICTGNYYRSRFSEALFNHLAIENGSSWRAFSRGVAIHMAPPGLSLHTQTALRERGIDLALTTTERQPLTVVDLERATHRIALKGAEHRPMMQRDFPLWEERVDYWNFHDLDRATAAEMIPTLAKHVTDYFESLASPASEQTDT